jgi:hypothetical protein
MIDENFTSTAQELNRFLANQIKHVATVTLRITGFQTCRPRIADLGSLRMFSLAVLRPALVKCVLETSESRRGWRIRCRDAEVVGGSGRAPTDLLP